MLSCGLLGCTSGRESGSAGQREETSVVRDAHPGRELAQQYCGNCHPVPQPDQLPRDTWPFVLDWMGNYLGYRQLDGRLERLVTQERIPDDSLVSPQELAALRDFFRSRAPEGPLRPGDKPPMQESRDLFEPVDRNILPPELTEWRNEVITMVDIADQAPRLFVGYGNENLLLDYETKGGTDGTVKFELEDAVQFDTQPVGLKKRGDTLYVTLIGNLMEGERKGQVVRLHPQDGQIDATHLVQDYYRTAHAGLHDLNGDGNPDLVVSGFGDFFGEGRLAWFENLGDGRFEEHVLWAQNGALKSAVHDFTGDGRPDIMALVAQERQELVLYVNEGENEFKRVQILRKFAGFGFNTFTLADFNEDGLMDILLVNGNNMEIPDPPLRDYHGVRVFLNRGDLDFEEAYFYPMYGALDASVADFTGNGRLDIAAISFYPDWAASSPETFVVLEQTQPMEFVPSAPPRTQGTRWLSIDAGDVDGDGRTDLALGGAGFVHGIPEEFRESFLKRFKEVPPVLILKNAASGR